MEVQEAVETVRRVAMAYIQPGALPFHRNEHFARCTLGVLIQLVLPSVSRPLLHLGRQVDNLGKYCIPL
jgi:hypothetical protein